MISIKEQLQKKIPEKNISLDCPMDKHTTFRCGGNAKFFVLVESLEELKFVIELAKANTIEYFLLGNGSNVLFTDGGFDGMVIKLAGEFNEIIVDGNTIIAGAGASLPYVSKLAAAYSLEGMEFACGIPGSIGGAMFMNAGAYGGTMADCVSSAIALTKDGELYEYELSEMEFAYRHSRFMEYQEIVLSVKFELKCGNPDDIAAKMEENNNARKTKQPISYPSAGSFFKRPEGYFAGALIQDAGLKGYSVGGAQVSELHAGFIINKDNASASDVLALCKEVQDKVFENSGIHLQPEVRIVGK